MFLHTVIVSSVFHVVVVSSFPDRSSYKIETPTPTPPQVQHILINPQAKKIIKIITKQNHGEDHHASSTDARSSIVPPLTISLVEESYKSPNSVGGSPSSSVLPHQHLYVNPEVVNTLLGDQQTSSNLIAEAPPNLMVKPLFLESSEDTERSVHLRNVQSVGSQEGDEENSQYDYEYHVKDIDGNDFGHTEKREGPRTWGSYFVHLPDGRLKTVKYWADHTGYHAEVEYVGDAHHPEPEDN